MPHGNAQRNAGVELLFGGALGHGVHGADEFVAVGSFLVEQGSRARCIERKGFKEAVNVVREVIFGLREIWEKNLVTLVQRDMVVLVFLQAAAELRDNFVGTRGILRRSRAHGGHAHVQVVRVMMAAGHIVDGVRLMPCDSWDCEPDCCEPCDWAAGARWLGMAARRTLTTKSAPNNIAAFAAK